MEAASQYIFRAHPRVEYYPPPKEVFHRFTRELCEALTRRYGVDYSDSEIVRGIAEFLFIVGKLEAKRLNKNGFDKEKNTR